MKSNPFYALSASAMLLGCWLLSVALPLQAGGPLGGLLLLMAVVQLYEGLLVGLGAFLVRTAAPRETASPCSSWSHCSGWTRRSSPWSASPPTRAWAPPWPWASRRWPRPSWPGSADPRRTF